MLKTPGVLCVILLGTIILSLSAPSQAGFMSFSLQDEAKLGKKFYLLMHTYYPVVTDPEIDAYLDRLRDRLIKVMPSQPFPISVELILDSAINAFAAPAGHVFVNSGLFLALDSCDELAAVLAHEFSHVAERHIAHNIERSKYIGLGTLAGVLAGALIGAGSSAGGAVAVSSLAGAQAASLKFSRDNEREADQVGLHFLTAAGFSEQSMLKAMLVLKRQSLLSGSSTPPPYLVTHPGLNERIGYIQDRIARTRAHRQGKNGPGCQEDVFYRLQSILRARYTDPRQALAYYQSIGKSDRFSALDQLSLAIIYRRLNNLSLAEKNFALCQDKMQDDYLWHREKGIFFYSAGQIDESIKELKLALRKNSGDYLARFYLGRCLDSHGKYQDAAREFKQILSKLQEDPDVHFALGNVLGKQGDFFRGYLEYAWSYVYRGRFKQAKFYQKKACALAGNNAQRTACKHFTKEIKERRQLLGK